MLAVTGGRPAPGALQAWLPPLARSARAALPGPPPGSGRFRAASGPFPRPFRATGPTGFGVLSVVAADRSASFGLHLHDAR
jgi:hypothetical protein